MKALVTGAGGFLGGALARQLLARGDDVRVFQRSDSRRLAALGATVHQGNLRDAEAVRGAAAGVETVFHTAAKVGVWGRREDFAAVNVRGTENIVAACRANDVGRLVFTSSASVVFGRDDIEGADESAPYPPHPLTHYTHTKAEAEKIVLAAAGDGLATVALRPHLVWGPGDPHLVGRMLQRVRQGRLCLVGDGQNKIDSTYVENAVDAHLLAADRLAPDAPCCGKAYFISNGEPRTLESLMNGILAAAEFPPVSRQISSRSAYALAAILECLYRLFKIDGEPDITRFVVREFAASHWFDIGAAKRDLGYAPRVSIDEGLRRLHASFFPA